MCDCLLGSLVDQPLGRQVPAHARVAIVCWLAMTAAIGLFTIYQWHNPAAVISEDRFQSTGERVGEQRFSTVLSDKSEYQLLEETPRALGSTSRASGKLKRP